MTIRRGRVNRVRAGGFIGLTGDVTAGPGGGMQPAIIPAGTVTPEQFEFLPIAIGGLYLSTVPTDPSVLLGFGTWALYAQGRVLVGINPGEPEFDTAGEIGGEKLHVLTCAELPSPC